MCPSRPDASGGSEGQRLGAHPRAEEFSGGELAPDGGKPVKEKTPGFGRLDGAGLVAIRHFCKTGAGDPVIEAQHPHPAALEGVVEGGIIRRKGSTDENRVVLGPGTHPGKMRKLRPGSREVFELSFWQTQGLMQVAPRAAGIDQETGACLEGLSVTCPGHLNAVGFNIADGECGFVVVFHAEPNGFLDQEGVEIGSIPMGVGHEVVGAGRHEQLIGTLIAGFPGFPR